MSDNKKRNALGRGLSALLDDADNIKNAKLETPAVVNINEIPVEQIETNPYQPRTDFDEEALKELAESIKVQGIIQPVTVRQLNKNKYQLISGERRLRASKLAGLKNIPVYIRTANDQQMLEMGLIENIQRDNLNAIEVAVSFQRLMTECNLKQEELGDRVGKNRSTVNNYLRLLKLPTDIQIAIRDNKISMGHARAIITVDKIEQQLYIFNRIVAEGLSVRQVEELVRNLSGNAPKDKTEKEKSSTSEKSAGSAQNHEIQQMQQKLSSHFGTKVFIKSDKQLKGELTIPFVSGEDLNRILEILNI